MLTAKGKMLLSLQREPSSPVCTLGSLQVDGAFECYTLEDVVRPLGEKIAGQTAIPAGRYKVIVDMSAHFSAKAGHPVYLPHILNVPGFEGVRIHSGNVAADTEGCVLVGNSRGLNCVLGSRDAFAALFPKIMDAQRAGEPIEIEVLNAPSVQAVAAAASEEAV